MRAALDSSPPWGAGRAEDTYDLLGHALTKALGVLARQQGRERADIAAAAGASLVGGSSLTAALGRNWDDPAERAQALVPVLDALTAVETWLDEQAAPAAPAGAACLAAAHRLQARDTPPSADGTPVPRQGGTPGRRISIEEEQVRHGRTSRGRMIDGDRRHVVRDPGSRLAPAVGLTAATVPEALAGEAIRDDLTARAVTLSELHSDRAHLSGVLVQERPADLTISRKAWPGHDGAHFPKTAFVPDWERRTIRCPNDVLLPSAPGETVHFPAATWAACPLRGRCTGSAQGRGVTLHPDERLLEEPRQRQLTSAGRAKLRERVGVEHTLAPIGRWQGDRARYRGVRTNPFDLRRCAVVHNLHVIAHWDEEAKAA